VTAAALWGWPLPASCRKRGYSPNDLLSEIRRYYTSQPGGGVWESGPPSLTTRAVKTPEFRRSFADAARIAFTTGTNPFYLRSIGVRWLPLYTLARYRAYLTPPPHTARTVRWTALIRRRVVDPGGHHLSMYRLCIRREPC